MLSRIAKKSARRAIRTQSRWWFFLSASAFVLQVLHRIWKKQPKVVQRIRLEPGEAITVSVPPEETGSS